MNTARLDIGLRDLPEEVVLAVLDALESAGFSGYSEYDGPDEYAQARAVARTSCQPAASPAPLNGPTKPEATA